MTKEKTTLAILASVFIIILVAAYIISDSKAESCARLAAHPEENIQISGKRVGIASIKEINKIEAVNKCRAALAEADSPATKYHLSRALLSGKVAQPELDEAKILIRQSIDQGYGFANMGAGYIASNFEPKSGALAAEHFLKAASFGAISANAIAGYVLLFRDDTKNRRLEGMKILETEALREPSFYLPIASYYQGLTKNRENWKRAESILLEAKKKGVAQANLKLAKMYWEKGSPLRSVASAREMAKEAVSVGIKEGYEIWLKSYYFAKDHNSALIVARRGAKAGNIYSAYVAGHMLYYGQGTDKNTIEAEKLLIFAANNGSIDAKKLLRAVTLIANLLRKMPSSNPQNCVKSRLSSYDKSIIDYRNGCSTALNALICSRYVATELFSLLDGKDRERCRRKRVGPGQYIDNFYGSNKNSSLARKAISNTNVKIGVCHPPLQPNFNGNKVQCKE